MGLVFLCAPAGSEDGEAGRADARGECPMSETKQMQGPRGPESPTVPGLHCREYHAGSLHRAILEADR